MVRIGTSGWHYQHWQKTFYPLGLPSDKYLHHYSQFFDTVELNGVFYRLPAADVVRQWYRRAPAGFLFAYKASRYLTHMKKLRDPAPALRLMFQRADLLKEKLGPILYQLPPFYPMAVDRLKTFLRQLPSGYQHVMEFRHASWFTKDIFDLLLAHRVGLCLYDMKGVPSPEAITSDIVYVRMHGSQQKYAGSYPLTALHLWARKIQRWKRRRSVYVYFNNDVDGHAIENARDLKGML